MTWKSELDRTIQDALRRALDDKHPDAARAITLANEFVGVAPGRGPSHFALGLVEESLSSLATAPVASPPAADAEAPAPAASLPVLGESPTEDAALWRWLGRLDTAARIGRGDRVRALAAEPTMDLAAGRATEGRLALRAAGRALLMGDQDARAYELYARHLRAAGDDETARKDAESLVGDAVRHADDRLSDGDEAGARAALDRALSFVTAAGLDGRAGAKIERKLGRAHQLAGRWAEAADAYRAALSRLAPEDRYRFVLHGDLALASLEVRGTLDLLPKEGRPGAAEAERVLGEAGGDGEGESYNAIYTLGVLAYERGDWATAADRFREADRLMRETRAKARIVHARARFFLGACLLRQGATGEALREAEGYLLRDAQAANLDPAVKDPVLELLAQASPGARIPGRAAAARGDEGRPEAARASGPDREPRPPRDGRRERGGRRGGGRAPAAERLDRYAGGREDRAPRAASAGPGASASPAAPVPAGPSTSSGTAGGQLAEARRVLDADPHAALRAVDEAFKSRPTFEEWYASYRIRLEALIRLSERAEALRTYERFRAKLHERGRADRLEELLLDASGPMAEILEAGAQQAELVDLYEVLPGRDRQFIDACVALAGHHAQAGGPTDLRKAVSLLREAIARGGDEARALWEETAARARAAGVSIEGPAPEDVRARLAAKGPA